MCICAAFKQQGSILASVLIVLAVMSFILLRSYELNLRQHELSQLYKHKLELFTEVESELQKKTILPQYFHFQDHGLNSYYFVEAKAQNEVLEVNAAVWLVLPSEQHLPSCDGKEINKIFRNI